VRYELYLEELISPQCSPYNINIKIPIKHNKDPAQVLSSAHNLLSPLPSAWPCSLPYARPSQQPTFTRRTSGQCLRTEPSKPDMLLFPLHYPPPLCFLSISVLFLLQVSGFRGLLPLCLYKIPFKLFMYKMFHFVNAMTSLHQLLYIGGRTTQHTIKTDGSAPL
jgi:hypothetical protein